MKYFLFLLVAVALSVSCCAAGANRGWSEGSLRNVILGGISKAVNGPAFAHVPGPARDEMERVIADLLVGRLTFKFRRIDASIEGSFNIAKDFVTKSVKAAAMRTRWPKEQLLAFLEESAAEAEKQATTTTNRNSSKISPLDRETIINDIIQSLLQDPSFVAVIEWLVTVPDSIRNIADALFANKTFSEIFAMLGVESNRVLLEEVMEDVPVAEPSNAAIESAFGLVQAGLNEAQPTIELVTKAYRQLLKEHVGEVTRLLEEEYEKMPFVDKDVIEYIKTAALHLMN